MADDTPLPYITEDEHDRLCDCLEWEAIDEFEAALTKKNIAAQRLGLIEVLRLNRNELITKRLYYTALISGFPIMLGVAAWQGTKRGFDEFFWSRGFERITRPFEAFASNAIEIVQWWKEAIADSMTSARDTRKADAMLRVIFKRIPEKPEWT